MTLETELMLKKRAELGRKLAGLRQSFATLRADATEGAPLAQLRTQVVAITSIYDALVQRIEYQLDVTLPTLEGLHRVDSAIATIDELWHWFFSRLAIRYSGLLAEYLKAADAFVWACYQPMYLAMASGDLAPE